MDGSRESKTTEERARVLAEGGDVAAAATLVLRELGPEMFGFLRGTLSSHADADEVFAATSERIWRSLQSFQWRSSLRTWVYVIARNEAARLRRGARRQNLGRVTSSELDDVIAEVRTETRSALRTAKRDKIRELRDELSVDDRTLLILRIDRELEWPAVARVFLGDEVATEEVTKREAARLRKRFQLIKQRLAERAREEGLL